jgi:Fuc2NAc and GlcNAc transferase
MSLIAENASWPWIAALALSFGASAALTGWFRRYALAREILDHPNERSSHQLATPRGGGVAFVVVILTALLGAALAGWMPSLQAAAIGAGGLLVAMVGWWDDRWGLAARWRFLAHLCASGLLAVAVGPVAGIPLAGTAVSLGWLVLPAATLGITYLINITNFMDGIDGIAAGEAAFVFASAGLLAGGVLAIPAAIAAAACCGFLMWNWPPAKIFMGDVGSGFLGFLMGVFILAAAAANPNSFWALAILPGTFFVDGTVTLVRRIVTGQKWTKAHRSHAYQHAAQRWGHLRVMLTFVLLNLVWILPLSWLAARHPAGGAGLLVLSWLPLGGLALWQRAGLLRSARKTGE